MNFLGIIIIVISFTWILTKFHRLHSVHAQYSYLLQWPKVWAKSCFSYVSKPCIDKKSLIVFKRFLI